MLINIKFEQMKINHMEKFLMFNSKYSILQLYFHI